MKLYTLIVLLLVVSFSVSRRLRTHRHKNRHHSRALKDNPLYQFLLGFLAELSGQPAFIDQCSQQVKGWEAAGVEETKENKTDGELKETSSTFGTILGYLGKVVDFICGFKDKIISFLTGATRRYIRLFLQGKIKRRFTWGLNDMWNTLKSTASIVGNAIVSGASKVKDAVVDGVKWVGKKAEEAIEYIKKKIDEVFKPVYDLFEKIKAKFLAYLQKSPILMKLFEFARCFIENKGVKGIKTLFSAVSSLVTLIPKLTTPAGWVELVVNLICGWESLKDGIGYLMKAVKENDSLIRYNLYGKFTGKIFEAIAG